MRPGASNVRCSPVRSRLLASESKEASRKGRAESVIWQQSGGQCVLDHFCVPRRNAVDLGEGVKEGHFTFSFV